MKDAPDWKWEAPIKLSYRGSYEDGFKAGQEAMHKRCLEALKNERLTDETGDESDESYNVALDHATGAIAHLEIERPT